MKTERTIRTMAMICIALAVACKKDPIDIPEPQPNEELIIQYIDDSLRDEFNDAVETLGLCVSFPAPVDPPQATGSPTEDTQQQGSLTWSCTTTPMVFGPEFSEASIFSPNEITWVGSFLRGSSIPSGAWTPVVYDDRNPITMSITLNTGTESPACTMEHPSLSAYTDCLNTLVNAAVPGSNPAYIDYWARSVHSEQEVEGHVGMHASGWGGSIFGSYDWSSMQQKSRFLLKYTQKYFSVTADIPAEPDDWFGLLPDHDQMANYCPVYVSSIHYGRIVYILIESTSSSSEVQAAINASWSGFGFGASVDFTNSQFQTLQETNIHAFIVGGNAAGAVGGLTGEGLNDILNAGSEFSTTSPGAPIAMTVLRLSDNSVVNFVTLSEYNVQECTPAGETITINPPSAPQTFCPVRPSGFGDDEFEGNGPDVTGSVHLMIDPDDQTKIIAVVHAVFNETIDDFDPDDTKATIDSALPGNRLTLATAPYGKVFSSISVNPTSTFHYVDSDHTPDAVSISSAFVESVLANGDTDDDDLPCTNTNDNAFLRITFEPFEATVVDQE